MLGRGSAGEGGIVARPDGGEKVARGTRFHRILAELPELEVIELTFGPDFEGVPPHSHADHVDSFYVLAGEVDFTAGDDEVRAAPGTWYSAPPDFRHGFRNPGPGRARVLNVHTPDGGFTGRVRGG